MWPDTITLLEENIGRTLSDINHRIIEIKTKINSKLTKNLNARLNHIKPPEENKGRTLFDINYINIFLDLSPSVMEIKTKINKWDLTKLKRFCTAKETINKRKR